MFNPRSIEDLESASIDILNPQTKRKTGATVTLAGPDHPKARSILLAAQRRVRRDLEKSGRITLDDPEAEEDARLEELVARTLAWTGMADDDGKEMPCTPDNARKLYAGVTWLRLQLMGAMNDRANFIRASSAS